MQAFDRIPDNYNLEYRVGNNSLKLITSNFTGFAPSLLNIVSSLKCTFFNLITFRFNLFLIVDLKNFFFRMHPQFLIHLKKNKPLLKKVLDFGIIAKMVFGMTTDHEALLFIKYLGF